MDWSDALLFFAVLLALFASAWAAGLAQGTARRNRRETGVRLAPARKTGQSAGPEADGAEQTEDEASASGDQRQETAPE